MRQNIRANLYAAVPPLAALLVGLGVFTDLQGAAVAGLAVQTITLVFACYYAVRQGAPLTRSLVYGFVAAAAAVGTAWGALNPGTVELLIPAIMGIVGLLVAESNTPTIIPGEIVETGADGRPDNDPQRIA